MKKLLFLLFFFSINNHFIAQAQESASSHDTRIEWWREARFGMIVHWGLYSSMAGVWEGNTYQEPQWIQHNAGITRDAYEKSAVPHFKPKDNFAKEWASLAKNTGCKYVIFAAKDYDGFALHDSKTTAFDAKDATGRDLFKEIVDALREEGIKVGIYYSLADWHHPHSYTGPETGLPHIPADIKGPRSNRRYVEYMHKQIDEMLSNYGNIDIIWWGASSPATQGQKWDAKKLMDSLRNHQPQIISNNRLYHNPAGQKINQAQGDFVVFEQMPSTSNIDYDWEICANLNGSWGYKEGNDNWRSSKSIIREIVETASKGGNYLLNIGPQGDGSIDENTRYITRSIGKWMSLYGESVYGTTANDIGDVDWGYVTTKGNKHYLHVFAYPDNNRLLLPVKPAQGSVNAYFLADKQKQSLPLFITAHGIEIDMRNHSFEDAIDTIVVLEGDCESTRNKGISAGLNGNFILNARDATLSGLLKIEKNEDGKEAIAYWSRRKDIIFWNLNVERAGTYELIVDYSCERNTKGKLVEFSIGDEKITGNIPPNHSWSNYKIWNLGQIDLSAGENWQLLLRAKESTEDGFMNIRSVRLVPINDNTIRLTPANAMLSGDNIKVEVLDRQENIGWWSEKEETAAWEAFVPEDATYSITLNYATPYNGTKIVLHIGDQSFPHQITSSGAWNHYENAAVGKISLRKGDVIPVRITVSEKIGESVVNLRSITLSKDNPGELIFEATHATVEGKDIRMATGSNPVNIGWWSGKDIVKWPDTIVNESMDYDVFMEYSYPLEKQPEFDIQIGQNTLHHKANFTGSWNAYCLWKIGDVTLRKGEVINPVITTSENPENTAINLRALKILPKQKKESNSNVLSAREAHLDGKSIRLEMHNGIPNIGWWKTGDKASWAATVPESGLYKVIAYYSCAVGQTGSEIELSVNDKQGLFTKINTATASWNDYEDLSLGTVYLNKGESAVLSIKALDIKQKGAINLRSIKLIPARQNSIFQSISLMASDAIIEGETILIEGHEKKNIGYWLNTQNKATWFFDVPRAGTYEIFIDYSCSNDCQGSLMELNTNGTLFEFTSEGGGSWFDYSFKPLGKIKLESGKKMQMALSALKIEGYGAINVRSIMLVPTEDDTDKEKIGN